MLMAGDLWDQVALYDGAPCAHTDWVVVLKQGCELGEELTVQLKTAVFTQEGRQALHMCWGQLAGELDRWSFEPCSQNCVWDSWWGRCSRETTDQVP